MKKILLTAVLFIFVVMAYSQLTFGPRLGMTFSKYAYDWNDSDSEPDTKFKIGPALGGVVNIPFGDYFSLQPALMFTKKGVSYDLEAWEGFMGIKDFEGYMRQKVGYIEIPVHATGRLDVGKGELQLFAGPYLAFAVVGRSKYDVSYTDDGERITEKETLKIKFKNTVTDSDWEDYWEDDEHGGFQKSIDFGFNFGLGYYFEPVLINAGYSLGLTNLQPNEEGEDISEYKYTNSVIFINVAWLFSCNKK